MNDSFGKNEVACRINLQVKTKVIFPVTCYTQKKAILQYILINQFSFPPFSFSSNVLYPRKVGKKCKSEFIEPKLIIVYFSGLLISVL